MKRFLEYTFMVACALDFCIYLLAPDFAMKLLPIVFLLGVLVVWQSRRHPE